MDALRTILSLSAALMRASTIGKRDHFHFSNKKTPSKVDVFQNKRDINFLKRYLIYISYHASSQVRKASFWTQFKRFWATKTKTKIKTKTKTKTK